MKARSPTVWVRELAGSTRGGWALWLAFLAGLAEFSGSRLAFGADSTPPSHPPSGMEVRAPATTNPVPTLPEVSSNRPPSLASLPLATNRPSSNQIVGPFVNPALRNSQALFASSNLLPVLDSASLAEKPDYHALLEDAWRYKRSGDRTNAEKRFVRILEGQAPTELQKTSLLELAVLAHEHDELARAQQIYAQFLNAYPGDPDAPEVLLRQGLIYRQMGAPVMALSKFYSVMSSALNLKLDSMDYYQRLVLHAQSEIADTYYLQGKYDQAAEFFTRLLKLNSPDLDKMKILHKLVRSSAQRKRYNDVIVHATEFLDRYPDAEPAPEVHFLAADAFKRLGRNQEAIGQVLALLQSQQKSSNIDPQNWTYWRQRTGNELGNQFYQEGDYMSALQIYKSLASLSASPDWQLPALYQVGLVYERLRQSQKALDTYEQILKERSALGTNAASPSISAVLDMAEWRKGFVAWQQHADDSNRKLNPPESTSTSQ
jgi:tetratricopeptide (TPR) repeat protein